MSVFTIPLSEGKIKYFRYRILIWGKNNYSIYPWRETNNMWHALVAEIMLQRTNAEQVLPVYLKFCKKYENPRDFLKKNNCGLFNNLGLYWKEDYLKKLAESILKNGIPANKESLKRFPAIGNYIASAFLSMHSGKRDVIIDSNVVRILGRFFGFQTDGETRRKKWFYGLADTLTPRRKFKEYNYGLIDFTRLVCKPKPRCFYCILKYKCYLNRSGK